MWQVRPDARLTESSPALRKPCPTGGGFEHVVNATSYLT
jgi:hypothetical protein